VQQIMMLTRIPARFNTAPLNTLQKTQRRCNSTLILGEHDNNRLLPSTLSAVTAAVELKKEINILLAGSFSDVEAISKQTASIAGVTKVFVANSAQYAHAAPERVAPLLKATQEKTKATHVIAPSTANGKGVLPRTAAMLDSSAISDVIKIQSEDTFVRPIYAGNAISTVKSHDAVKFFTIRTTAFEKATETGGSASVENLSEAEKDTSFHSEWISEDLKKSARPELTAANVVVSGGRGLKSAENFKLIEELADELNGAVGASRAAVDAGYVSNDLQVGQTGKIVAPQLYIAVGISGAIQHLAGMKDSKVIVSINKDTEAPIAQVADLIMTKDLFEAIPQLTQAIRDARGK